MGFNSGFKGLIASISGRTPRFVPKAGSGTFSWWWKRQFSKVFLYGCFDFPRAANYRQGQLHTSESLSVDTQVIMEHISQHLSKNALWHEVSIRHFALHSSQSGSNNKHYKGTQCLPLYGSRSAIRQHYLFCWWCDNQLSEYKTHNSTNYLHDITSILSRCAGWYN